MAAKKKTRSKSKATRAKKTTTKTKVSPIAPGYSSVMPYLMVNGGEKAIEFYKTAFGAKEKMRMPGPNGTVGHAELKIGDSIVMLADEDPGLGYYGPQRIGGTAVGIHVYIPEVDKVVARAVAAGAKLTRPVEDKFYGDRSGTIEDPFGHRWHVTTHVEEVSEKEMARRAAAQPLG